MAMGTINDALDLERISHISNLSPSWLRRVEWDYSGLNRSDLADERRSVNSDPLVSQPKVGASSVYWACRSFEALALRLPPGRPARLIIGFGTLSFYISTSTLYRNIAEPGHAWWQY